MINMNIVNIILGVTLIIFGGLILLGAPLMYLWNYVVPSIFGLLNSIETSTYNPSESG